MIIRNIVAVPVTIATFEDTALDSDNRVERYQGGQSLCEYILFLSYIHHSTESLGQPCNVYKIIYYKLHIF